MEREHDDECTLVGSSSNNTPINKNWSQKLVYPSDCKNKGKRKELILDASDPEDGEKKEFQYNKSPFKSKYNFKQSKNKQGTAKRCEYKCDSCDSSASYRYDPNALIENQAKLVIHPVRI